MKSEPYNVQNVMQARQRVQAACKGGECESRTNRRCGATRVWCACVVQQAMRVLRDSAQQKTVKGE